jgi:hypothetical protein
MKLCRLSNLCGRQNGAFMVKTYAFTPHSGALYAQNFALYDHVPPGEQLFYYDPEDDCTNFISQCVWAAYGGWIPGFTDETVAKNAQRIKNNVRQVGGVWYGSKNYIGSNIWCRVGELYDYVTSEKKIGPTARKIAEGSFFSVDPKVVAEGDVIQMVVASYTPDRYGHGLYVTKAGAKWEDILICCHSFDRLDAPMSIFSQFYNNYRKLRVLRFESAGFED